MATTQHRRPTIAAASTARNAFGREILTTAKGWAARSDLSSYANGEIEAAYALLLKSEQALRPFYSAERTAYCKLRAEMERRHLLGHA